MDADETAGDPLRVVHLSAPAEVGGLERVVQGLSIGMSERGHEVLAVAVVEPGTEVDPFLGPMAERGVSTLALELPGRAYGSERRNVARLLDRIRPSVLHTHGYRPDLLHGAPARRRGIATFSTLHGSSRMGGASHLFEWLQLRALRRFDGVIAVSRPLALELTRKGVPAHRIHHIPNAWHPTTAPVGGAEARAHLGVDGASGALIGWVGRLIPIKGCDIFLEALSQLPGTGPAWTAVIVGDGPERRTLEARVPAMGLEGRVRFLGAVPDAGRFFSAFDLYVLSSRSEGTPMVLLEAMEAQVPVVASGVGGVPELLEEGRAGSLVPAGAPAALRDAILHVLRSPEASTRLAAQGRARVESEYDPRRWILRHEAAYRSVLGGPPPRQRGG